MDYNSNLIRFLILAPILPAAITLYVLFRRKLHHEVPWFAAYLLTIVVGSPLLYLVYQHGTPWDYFYSAHYYDAVTIITAFMVIFDVFRTAVADYESIRRTGQIFLAIVGIGLLALAIGIGYSVPTNAYPIIKTILTIERSVRIIQVGLIVAIFAFSSLLGLSWRHHVFGIALGFGLYAASNLAGIAYVAQVGSTVAYKVLLLDQFSYLCTMLIWLMYLLKAEHTSVANFPVSSRRELQRWNHALSGFLARPSH